MQTRKVLKTLAALGYGLALMAQNVKSESSSASPSPPSPEVAVNTLELEKVIGKLAKQVKIQNNFWNRLVLGVAAGVGTALGASVIAALVLLVLGPLLQAVGIDIDLTNGA